LKLRTHPYKPPADLAVARPVCRKRRGPIWATVLTLTETSAGICVSTVSSVSVCGADLSDRARADPIARRRGASRAGCAQGCRDTAPMVADGADGADGIFLSCTYSNDPGSSSAFATELNVDAKYPQERLRPTQAACERAGIFGPTATVPRNARRRCPSPSCARP
jgi:hypothetical protein